MTPPVRTSVAVKRYTPNRRIAWLVGVALLITVALVAAAVLHSSRPGRPARASATHLNFGTLPPGAQLPSGAQCARRVRAYPSREIVPANEAYNQTVGQNVGPGLFPPGDSPQVKLFAPLINGDFTGTTEQILEWAACKWGIDQDIVFAQAAAESSWQQDHLGDWGSGSALCPPGHGLGADGIPGQCPQSYGILQIKSFLWRAAWPGIADSTAMNVDVAYAIWRSCFDGYEIWLRNSASSTHPYQAGDLWGCLGRWYAGSWYTPTANRYIDQIKGLLQERAWEQPGFISAAANPTAGG